jgi:hypothetical protein
MTEEIIPPEKPDKGDQKTDATGNTPPWDLHALNRIAENNPELAHKIVEQRDHEDRRFNVATDSELSVLLFWYLWQSSDLPRFLSRVAEAWFIHPRGRIADQSNPDRKLVRNIMVWPFCCGDC